MGANWTSVTFPTGILANAQIIQFGTSPLNWIAGSTGEIGGANITSITNDGGVTWGSVDGTLKAQIIEASGNPSYNPNISQMEIVIKPWVAA